MWFNISRQPKLAQFNCYFIKVMIARDTVTLVAISIQIEKGNVVENVSSAVETLVSSSNTLFILLGAIMVFFMHAGFAFLEVGTVRHKNQVNALVKIITDFAISAVAYFFVGYTVAYGADFFVSAEELSNNNGYDLVKFFFLLTFAAAIPAIVSCTTTEPAKSWN